jgi:hypothetical protein
MPFMPDLEQPTQTWVADRDSAWSAGSALTLVELQRPQFLLFAAAALVGLPWLLAAAGTQGTAFGLVLGLVLAGFLLGSCAAISLWGKVRYFRRVLPPGHRLACRFGPSYLVLAEGLAETTVQFARYDELREVGDWVLLKQRDRRVRVIYPRALIPADDLARLRMTILGGPPEPPEDQSSARSLR